MPGSSPACDYDCLELPRSSVLAECPVVTLPVRVDLTTLELIVSRRRRKHNQVDRLIVPVMT